MNRRKSYNKGKEREHSHIKTKVMSMKSRNTMKSTHRDVIFLSIVLSICLNFGCPTPPPPVFEACGEMKASILGRMGVGGIAETVINTEVEVNENSTSVEWHIPDEATGTVMDDSTQSGDTTVNSKTKERTFTAKGTKGSHTIIITGTIKKDCTGSGEWEVRVTESNKLIGKGTWSIP